MRPPPKLAFGVEPSNRAYRLRLARYVGIAEMLAQARESAPSNGPFRVLDAGCGKGRVPPFYRPLQDGQPISFVGIDISPGRLQQARSAGYDALGKAGIERLPFRDAAFDGLVCEQVLEHLHDDALDRTLREFRRVLRPQGCLIVGVPIFMEPELWVKPLWLWARKVLASFTGSTPDHHQHFSIGTLSALLRRHDFQVLHARGYRLFSFFCQWFEDLKGYYLAHQRMGRYFPWLCGEIDVVCRRK